MKDKLGLLLEKIEQHTKDIWAEEPRDIFRIKNGYFPSGAGIKDQYFTTIVMLSGEMRALGIHIFPDLIHYCVQNMVDFPKILNMTKRALQIDLGVISYFGLEEYGILLDEYFEALEEMENMEEYLCITKAMFTLTNRYQLWMHQIFPWYLSVHFPKLDVENTEKLLRQI